MKTSITHVLELPDLSWSESFWLNMMYLHHSSMGWSGQKISDAPRHSDSPKFCHYLQEVSK